MMYVAQIIGLLLLGVGVFKRDAVNVCEYFSFLGAITSRGYANSCASVIYNNYESFFLAGTVTIILSLILIFIKHRHLRAIWFLGFLGLVGVFVDSIIPEAAPACFSLFCILDKIVTIAFYTISLLLWTLLILGISLLIKYLRSRKIKPTLK